MADSINMSIKSNFWVFICTYEKILQEGFAFRNKTRTSKVGAISKPQKAQNIFLEKNLKFLKNFLSENVSVPKNVKGGHFLIYKYTFCCKITKNSKGGPFGDIKIFEKKVGAEKNRKGGPFSLGRFCRLR